ncbi:MAG TPA: DNA polymerase III subunit gamma/tau [Candidatus Omnitrophica bacterium]|nr:DNA polymerase III subunit gamma/tau [Candidatus Omnitrophota bacterium]
MSYLVFARKWRPRDFDEVVGQEHVTKTLKSAIAANKLAHAYLFAGSQGVGKTSCARILAKSLNCVKGPTVKPCGECSTCMEIAEGRSLDVIEIDGASNRGIDEIRTLRENVKFAPLNGRYKIYIIDEVHMLTPEAFNALLKTLEEPPSYVKFVFATTHPQKVLPTILSRCQRFDFIRIPNLKIVDKLKEIARLEGVEVDADVFFAIAKACEGSLRDAESILDQLISFTQKDINLQDVVSVLGIIEQDSFIDLVNAVAAQDASCALKLIDGVMARGKDMNYFLEGVLEHYRNLMVLKVVKSDADGLVDLPADTLKKLVEQASRLSLSDIMVSINQIFAAQDMARKLGETRIPLEILAVKLSMLGQKRPAVVEPQNLPGMAILKEEKGSVDSSLTSFGPASACTLSDVAGKWDAIIAQLSQTKMSLATYLKEARATRLENNTLTLGFPKNAVFFKEAMAHKDNLKIFESALKSAVGAVIAVKLEIVDSVEPDTAEQDEVDESPLLKSTLDLFKGRVIKKV